MARKVTLYTAQFGDMPLEQICAKAKAFGYDGLELACNENHVNLERLSPEYCEEILATLKKHDLELYTISSHCVGQCICDPIDFRHKGVLPPYIWGDGDPEGVRQRAAEEMIKTGKAAAMLGASTVVGFTGSPIWHMLYAFPPFPQETIDEGFKEVARRMKSILDSYQEMGVRFALEVHPTEIAFDISSSETLLKALDYHPAFGFNYDPSHMGYQGVDYLTFIRTFPDRIFHVHCKDVWWSDKPTKAGVFGGHLTFGHPDRYWDFRSVGRGKINFEEIIRELNRIKYTGPLSVEWEDGGMNRESGAAESLRYVKQIDFEPSEIAFDAAFQKE
ncbi:MAG: sugar phosphate isomerase/epimerase family protein [Bacteroidaceae bacterium]|nr:sugar phosphate isomerase/epimerase family protein [Bacteroidaceae bacterium]